MVLWLIKEEREVVAPYYEAELHRKKVNLKKVRKEVWIENFIQGRRGEHSLLEIF